MINLQNYPNISTYVQRKGGLKDSLLNKGVRKEWEASWERVTTQDLELFDREIVNGNEVFDAVVTPNFIMVYRVHCVKIIPVRDIIWMYARVVKSTMYFIPYNKTHSLLVLDRFGNWETLGSTNTGGFSKKTPGEDACQFIGSIIGQTRPGIVFGYSDELARLANKNLNQFVAMVDSKS